MSLSLAATMVRLARGLDARTGGNSAKAPRPTTTMAAAVPIAARRRWRRLAWANGKRSRYPAGIRWIGLALGGSLEDGFVRSGRG